MELLLRLGEIQKRILARADRSIVTGGYVGHLTGGELVRCPRMSRAPEQSMSQEPTPGAKGGHSQIDRIRTIQTIHKTPSSGQGRHPRPNPDRYSRLETREEG